MQSFCCDFGEQATQTIFQSAIPPASQTKADTTMATGTISCASFQLDSSLRCVDANGFEFFPGVHQRRQDGQVRRVQTPSGAMIPLPEFFLDFRKRRLSGLDSRAIHRIYDPRAILRQGTGGGGFSHPTPPVKPQSFIRVNVLRT